MNSRVALSLSALILLAGCHHKTSTPMMKTASATVPAVADNQTFSLVVRVGPAKLYPNRSLTPGKYDTLTIADLTSRWKNSCPGGKEDCTYSQAHRSVPASIHRTVYDNYKVPADERNIQDGEVDHLYPLCAGGSNDIENLWYQPAENKWRGKNFGYHEKDNLEKYICKAIVNGEVDPEEAYKKITTDWVAYYLELHLGKDDQGADEEVD